MARVDRTERLLNLVICLMATSVPVPRNRIRTGVFGYGDATSDASFERMFERDKEELRSMGIPVETVVDVNGEVTGYRIDKSAYRLAAGEWTLGERMALALAARTWADASDATFGSVVGAKTDYISGLDAAVRPPAAITAADAALLPLMRSVRDRGTVRFEYSRAEDDTAAARTVSPWGLEFTGGHWYLHGFDHERKARRTFRVSRMQGQVNAASIAFQEPPSDLVAHADRPAEPAQSCTALVSVRKGHGAALRRAALRRDAAGTVDDSAGVAPLADAELVFVEFPSRSELVAAVLSAGPGAVVIEPADLRASIMESLAALAALHPADAGSTS